MKKIFNNTELFDYVVKNGSYDELLTFLGRLHADRVQSQVLAGSNPGKWKVGKSRPDVYRREIDKFHDCVIGEDAGWDFSDWYKDICCTYGDADSGVRRYDGLLSIGYYLSVGAAREMLRDAVETEAQARESAGGSGPFDLSEDEYDNYLKSILIDLVNNDPRFLM